MTCGYQGARLSQRGGIAFPGESSVTATVVSGLMHMQGEYLRPHEFSFPVLFSTLSEHTSRHP